MSKEPKEQPKTTNLDDWTDKQLATLRRDSVSLAIEAIKIKGSVQTDALTAAMDFFNFIKDGKLPALPKTLSPPETPEPKAGGWK